MSGAMNAAQNANNNPSGFYINGRGGSSNQGIQWNGTVGKTVYEKGNFSVGAGMGLQGNGMRLNPSATQFGASFKFRF